MGEVLCYDIVAVNELFTILEYNTTLKALRVELRRLKDKGNMSNTNSIELKLNQTLTHLEFYSYVPTISSTYLSHLTTGLKCNNSLQELSVPIPLSHTNNQQLQTFFYVMSEKHNFTKLKIYFRLDQSDYSHCSDEIIMKEELTKLYYEQGLPHVTSLLMSHKTIQFLRVGQIYYDDIDETNFQKQLIKIKQLLNTVLIHPSLKYFYIQKNMFLKELLDECKKQLQPHPIVDINYF